MALKGDYSGISSKYPRNREVYEQMLLGGLLAGEESKGRYADALSVYNKGYQSVLDEISGLKEVAGQPISESYTEAAELFAAGGGYGAGQKALIEEERKKSRASAFKENIASGMWSGTTATGAQQRANRYAATALLGVEDVRTEKYAEALESLGAAEEARKARQIGAYSTAAQLTGTMATAYPKYGDYYNPVESTLYSAAASAYGNFLGSQVSSPQQNLSSQRMIQSWGEEEPQTGLSETQLSQYELYGVLPSGYSAGE